MNTTDPRAQRSRPPIGLLLKKLDSLINERFDRTLGSRDISRRQWQLLNTLAERPATLAALNTAVAPFLDHATGETTEQHLGPLQELGFVTATRQAYELTDSGNKLLVSLIDDVRATRELTVQGLTEDDYDRTISSLQTMVDNLEEPAVRQ